MLAVETKGSLREHEKFTHFYTGLVNHLPSASRSNSPVPRCKLDYDFVDETLLTWVKERSEVASEVSKESLDQLGLVFGRKLLVEISGLYDQIEIVFICVFHIGADAFIHSARNESRSLGISRFFKLEAPDREVEHVICEHA